MSAVTWPAVSGIPEDACVHTFNWSLTAGTDPVVAAGVVRERLQEFYGDAPTGFVNNLNAYFANTIDRAAAYIQVYDHSEPKPRVPILENLLGADIGDRVQDWDIPAEVAVCLSYHAEFQSGAPKARRRGRVYMGPFNGGVLSQVEDGEPARPISSFVEILRDAGKRLADYQAAAGVSWAVWSRVDDEFNNVTGGWVDDAYDTQRRRGQLPALRNQFVAE